MADAYLTICDWVMIASVTVVTLREILRFMTTRSFRSLVIVLPTLWVFYALPVGLDYLVGRPDFTNYPGFALAVNDRAASLAYDVSVCLCFAILVYNNRMIESKIAWPSGTRRKDFSLLCWIGLFAPIFALPFAPNPMGYAAYAAALSSDISGNNYHQFLAKLCTLSVMFGMGLLLVRRRFFLTCLMILPGFAVSWWLQGKRSIVLISIVLVFIAASVRGWLTFRRAVVFGGMAAVFWFGFTSWYQETYRANEVSDYGRAYDNFRVDLGRDSHLKAALLCANSNGAYGIVNYPAESIVFYATMYVPRSMWPWKPWPYAVNMTAFALQLPKRDFGWGVTTSVIDEAVANFGWLGVLLGPLLVRFLCRVADSSDLFGRTVGGAVVCLALAVEATAFMPLLILWVVYIVHVYIKWKRSDRKVVVPARAMAR